MKIIQVIDTLNVGGAERVFVNMNNILFENRQKVSILFLLDGGLLKSELNQGIVQHELHRKNKWSLIKMKECSQNLKSFDIIHCHLKHVYRYVALVNFLFPFDGKIILQDHGLFNKKKNFHLLLSQIFKPKYYIGVSRSLTEWAIQYLGISFKNVFLLENSIVKKDNKAEISKHFDFILVSNIKRNKNNAFAIELAESMNKPLLLVGKIQDEDYYNSIKSKLNNAINLDSTISNAQSVMHCADFALHTSLSETGPIVLLEYIAQHKPFLAFETGEIAVILKKYFPLFFIDNFDVKKWQERIEKIKEFPLDYTKFDEVLEKEFGQEKYYQKLVSIYSCVQKNN